MRMIAESLLIPETPELPWSDAIRMMVSRVFIMWLSCISIERIWSLLLDPGSAVRVAHSCRAGGTEERP